MNARKWIGLSLSLMIVMGANAVARADGSRPDRETLAQMGLGGMTVLSDREAMSVRGHGYRGRSSVAVFGNSFATYNTPNGMAHTENGYASEGKHFATGSNYSQAGVEFKKWGGYGSGRPQGSTTYGGGPSGGTRTSVKSVRVFAGGHSFGAAF